ncbi:MAG: caspase family protein [Pseudonocardiaceae bacterium]
MTDAGLWRDYSRSRAVLIGVWGYSHLPPVPAARTSLQRMAGLLTGPLGGWPAQRLEMLRNPRQCDRLPDRLMELFDGVVDVALFYFVGHGQLHGDELCLALGHSPKDTARRLTIGLPFADVRAALRECDAQTKIVILDCCFAGQVTRPEHSLAAASADVIDKTAGTGAFTMTASGAYRTAWFESDPGTINPQTYFTKYLIDVIEQGLPGHPEGLPLGAIFTATADALARDRRPEPTRSVRHDADRFILTRNPAGHATTPASPPKALPLSFPARTPALRMSGGKMPWLLTLITVVIVGVFAGPSIYRQLTTDPTRTSGAATSAPSAPTVGGVWVHPHDQHATIGADGVLVLEADAYGAGGGVDVGRVQFTTDWGGWHVLCSEPAPPDGDRRYSCTWDMKKSGVPIGQEAAVSFDVYGKDGSKNLAPNGIHHVRWGSFCVAGPGGTCGGY